MSSNHAPQDVILEGVACRRALDGHGSDVISSGSQFANPATGSSLIARKYSEALLVMLMKANRSSKTERTADQGIIAIIADDSDPPVTMRGRIA